MPSGPSKRRISRPLYCVEELVGEVARRARGGCAARAARRRAAASRAKSCGGGRPSAGESMYWPARYCRRSFAGSLILTIATSGAGLSIDLDAARQLADLDVAGAAHFTHLDHEIGQRLRAAEEREALLLLVVGERRRLVRAVVDAGPRGSCPCTCRRRRCGSRRAASDRRAIAAASTVSPSSHANEMPLGFMVIWCGMATTLIRRVLRRAQARRTRA